MNTLQGSEGKIQMYKEVLDVLIKHSSPQDKAHLNKLIADDNLRGQTDPVQYLKDLINKYL